MEKLRELVQRAKDTDVHTVLGYASWTAYLLDVFGDGPLRLARDVRQELVAELHEQGLTVRAIAPIVGAGIGTVHRDIEAASVPNGTPNPVEATPVVRPREDNWAAGPVNPATGEVLEDAAVALVPVLPRRPATEALPRRRGRLA